MELAISIALGILMVEAYAWLPKISAWLIERAVSRLPAEDQARCREEWKASLDALPNSGMKLLHALSFRCAADRINADSIEAKLDHIERQLGDVSDKHSCDLQKMRTIKMAVVQQRASRKSLEHHADATVARLKSIEVPASQAPGRAANAKSMWDVVNAIEDLFRLLIVAVNRASNLTDISIDRLAPRLSKSIVK